MLFLRGGCYLDIEGRGVAVASGMVFATEGLRSSRGRVERRTSQSVAGFRVTPTPDFECHRYIQGVFLEWAKEQLVGAVDAPEQGSAMREQDAGGLRRTPLLVHVSRPERRRGVLGICSPMGRGCVPWQPCWATRSGGGRSRRPRRSRPYVRSTSAPSSAVYSQRADVRSGTRRARRLLFRWRNANVSVS